MSAYADLSRAEFLKMKGLKFKEAAVVESQGRDLKAKSREKRAKAYKDWATFRAIFGPAAPNPHRTPYNETAAGKAKVQRYRLMKAKAAARKAALAVSKAKKAKAAAALKVKQAAMRVAKSAKKKSSAQKLAAKKAAAKKAKEDKKAKIKANQAKKLAAKKKKEAEKAKKTAAKKAAAAEKQAAAKAAKAAKTTKIAAKPAAKSLLEVNVGTDVESEADADAEAEAEADAESEVESEAESVSESESDADLESEADSLEAEMQSMLDGDAELLSFIQLDAEVEGGADMGMEVEMSPAAKAAPGIEPLQPTSKQRKAAQAKKAAAAARAKAAEAAKAADKAAADAKAAAAAKAAAEAKAAADAKAAKAAAASKASAAMAAATAAAKALADAKAAEAAAKPLPANAAPADGELVSAEDINAPAVPPAAAAPAAAKPTTPAASAAPAAPAKPVAPAAPAAAAAASSTGSAAGPVQPPADPAAAVVADDADVPLGISYPGEDKDYKPVAKKPKKGANATPVNIDWRTRAGVLTPIKSQGQCGSCWAQSAVSVVESAIAIRTNRTAKPLSVQQLVSCDTADLGCDGGNPLTALQYLSNYAVASEKSYPYDAAVFAAGTPVPACDTALQSEKFPPVKEVATYESGDEEGIMRALLSGPVTALVDASTWQFYDGTKIVYPASGCKGDVDSLDHSVVIVGVGTLDNGERYYIVRNHWDKDWGSQGYIFLAAGLNTCGIALQVSEITLASHVGV